MECSLSVWWTWKRKPSMWLEIRSAFDHCSDSLAITEFLEFVRKRKVRILQNCSAVSSDKSGVSRRRAPLYLKKHSVRLQEMNVSYWVDVINNLRCFFLFPWVGLGFALTNTNSRIKEGVSVPLPFSLLLNSLCFSYGHKFLN